jgi:hypothetical protein
MPVDMSQIPVGTQQALAAQQGAISTTDMEAVLAQLAQDPEQLAQAMQALGLNVTPEQLMQVAEDWQDQAADKASGAPEAADESAEADQPQAASGADEMAEGTSDDTQGPGGSIGQDDAAEANAMASASEASDARPTPTGSPRGGAAMANRAGVPRGVGAAGVAGSPAGAATMDDLVSAMMMQGAAGNPNAAVPRAGNFRAPRGAAALPHSPSAGASSDPRMRAMISNLYRSASTAPVERTGAPAGPRGTTVPSTRYR